MFSARHQRLPRILPSLLRCFSLTAASGMALAAAPPERDLGALTQVGRYSVLAAGPKEGQWDLLAVTSAIDIPVDVQTVGEALHWLLRDSGYRLAAVSVMPDEVKALLELPLPAVHRRFEPMPLQTVIGLIVGPAFHLVQDPVHRLLAFERCAGTPDSAAMGEVR
ncbi:pili assembly chaperone [Parahaliea mediterranea]|uniref:PFGI-1 class ICE element type IV pilus protein PilL2 n=1 Tax=Parahaliea mediterranea TaxID=651086 RepID=UPI000E2FEC3D|nr:pili assembly chaperone [Parahaliea mediterranea]